MKTSALTWKATDPEGRRWELWAHRGKRAPVYIGRVLARPEQYDAGWFTGIDRRGNDCHWTERSYCSMAVAALALRGKAPASLARSRG